MNGTLIESSFCWRKYHYINLKYCFKEESLLKFINPVQHLFTRKYFLLSDIYEIML